MIVLHIAKRIPVFWELCTKVNVHILLIGVYRQYKILFMNIVFIGDSVQNVFLMNLSRFHDDRNCTISEQ